MRTAAEIERGLSQFTGTAEYRKFPGQPLLSTDGAAWLTESAECYWLALLIAYSPHLGEQAAPFQVWTADPQPDGTVAVEMREDTGEPAIYSRRVRVHKAPPCPLRMWAIYDGGAGCHVLMVPSEY